MKKIFPVDQVASAAVLCLALLASPNRTQAATVPLPSGSPGTTSPALRYGAAEVVKMYQGGISKDILVNYIDSSASPYHLDADEIIYFQRIGLPEDVTKAMLMRDRQLQDQQTARAAYAPPALPPYGGVSPGVETAPPPVVTPAAPAPQVTVIGSSDPYGYDYGGYGYGYPYYGYDSYPLAVGGGWYWGWNGRGWGWGRGGYGGYGGFRGVGYGGFRGGLGGFRGGGFGGFHGGGFSGGFHGGGFGGFHAGGGGGHGGGGHR